MKNSGRHGGALNLEISSVILNGHTVFEGNVALAHNDGIGNGGAISAMYGTQLIISGVAVFTKNRADVDGGAIHASDTHITMKGGVNFTCNSAQNGGSMYFRSASSLALEENTALTSSYNHASISGGAIFHEDSSTLAQCTFDYNGNLVELPHCFLTLNGLKYGSHQQSIVSPYSIISTNDTADKDGSFLYGSLIDKCAVYILAARAETEWILLYEVIIQVNNQNKVHPLLGIVTNGSKPVSSKTYKLCFCANDWDFNCSEVKTIETQRGRTFQVSLLATAQLDNRTPTTVTAKNPENGRVKVKQTLQDISENCTTLTFTPLRKTKSLFCMLMVPVVTQD